MKPLPKSLKKRREAAAKSLQRVAEPEVEVDPQPQPPTKKPVGETSGMFHIALKMFAMDTEPH